MFIHRIDAHDRIRFANEHWYEFARENGADGLHAGAVEGRPLWGAAQWATGELAAQALAASSLAALPLAVLAGPDAVAVLGRHAALAVALAFAAAALVPAVAVAAGALVVSGKADQLLAGLGGEVKAPPTAWLGVLPGLASAVAVLLAIDVGGWLRGGCPWPWRISPQ